MITYPTINDIKAERADLGLFLRWVTEKKAWYQSDPTATNADDNDAYLQPTVGVGRWVKQLAVNLSTNGLTWLDISTNTLASASFGYYCDTTGGTLTLTLPNTALKGQVIKVYCVAGTSILNKVIINPNGRLLGGIAGDRELLAVNDFVELSYNSDATGWAITNIRGVDTLRIATVSYTVANPVTLPNFTGIIDYLGKQKNTLSYQNPTSAANSRQIRIQNYLDGAYSGTIANLYNQIGGAEDSYLVDGTGDVVTPTLCFDFLTALVRPSAMMIGISNSASRWTSSRPRNVVVLGANNLTISPELIFSPNTSYTLRKGALYASFTDLKQLAFLTGQDLAAEWTLNSGTYYRLLNINSANYYRYIMIQYYGPNFANTNNGYIFINEVEFFGDIVAP